MTTNGTIAFDRIPRERLPALLAADATSRAHASQSECKQPVARTLASMMRQTAQMSRCVRLAGEAAGSAAQAEARASLPASATAASPRLNRRICAPSMGTLCGLTRPGAVMASMPRSGPTSPAASAN